MTASKIRTAFALAAAAAGLAAASAPAQAGVPLTALTADRALLSFDSDTPGLATRTPITGPAATARLAQIDRQDGSTQLWLATDQASAVHRVDGPTGSSSGARLLAYWKEPGQPFGFDVTQDGQVWTASRDGLGMGGGFGRQSYVAGDPAAGTTPHLHGLGTIDAEVALSPARYAIDTRHDTLVRQDGIKSLAGSWRTVGSLGVDVPDAIGFDVVAHRGDPMAFLTTTNGLSSTLYRVSLSSGRATWVGGIRTGRTPQAVIGVTSSAPSAG